MHRKLYYTVYGGAPAWLQMGIDEAMALYAGLRGVALARVYWFEPPAVTVGYFQRLSEAVDLAEAERLGVTVVRRLSGGGSVYHDPGGELTYSVAVPSEWLRGSSVAESMRLLATWVHCAVERLGGEPRFEGLNDVVVAGRKVSGNAQFRKYGAVLQHGTLLYHVDLETMRRVLRVPAGKGRRIEARVAGLDEVLGRRIERSEALRAMTECVSLLASRLGAEAVEAPLPRQVLEAGEAFSWRYRSREWLEKRP